MNLGSIMRTIVEVTPMAVGLRSLEDDDFIHVYDNPAGAAMFGRTPSELQGKRARELGVELTLLPVLLEKMRTALRTGTLEHMELGYDSPRGRRQVIKTFAAVPGHVDDDGRPLLLATLEDVTELRTLQAGLRRADRLSTLGTLTAAVGHEVASPLVALAASIHLAQRLVERGEVVDPQGKLALRLGEAHAACGHLTEVLMMVREFGRGGDRDQILRLSEAIRRATTLAGASIRHTVEVVVALDADPIVRGSIIPVTQIVLNLMLNGARAALQRHPDGGARIEIRSCLQGSDAVVEVIDNGPGIPDDVRAHLFEPFVTAHADTGGTGLGLYVARGLAESLGGSLSLDSSTGLGTTGRLVLRLAPVDGN